MPVLLFQDKYVRIYSESALEAWLKVVELEGVA